MPTIAYFLGIAVRMLYNDHDPPHFHVRYQGYRARVQIDTGDVIDGRLPRTAARLVKEWTGLRRDALMRNWKAGRQSNRSSELPDLMMIDVVGLKTLGNYRLEIDFSDGTTGVRDFAFLAERTGPMVGPLKDPAYFRRVFIEDGALTWPNGYDYDPIALHDEMKAEGLLHRADAAE